MRQEKSKGNKDAQKLYEVIQNNPGILRSDAASAIGRKTRHLNSILQTCEAMGLLLAESDYGELFTLEQCERL